MQTRPQGAGADARTRSRGGVARALIAGAAAALSLQWPAVSQAAGCHIKTLDLPVRIVGRRAIATVGINGTPTSLVVDSGAFFSFLTDAAAAQLQLRTHPLPNGMRIEGVTGDIEARATRVGKLALLGGEIPNIDFVVGGNEDVAGTMGLLGRNILNLSDIEFDLPHGLIRFVWPDDGCDKANLAYWAGERPVAELALKTPFRERLPAIRANVLVNGKKVIALFDTGAPSTLLTLDVAHDAGVKDADMKRQGEVVGGGTDRARAWSAPIDKVEFGGEAVLHNRLGVVDTQLPDAEMLVGIDFFLSHHVYVSRGQSKMYFTYEGGPVFASNAGAHADAIAADTAASDAGALDADALERRGAASLSRGDFASALADLDRACAMEPANAGHFWARARLHAAMQHRTLALADLDTTLQLDPGLSEARILRANLRERAGQKAQALEDLTVLDATLPAQSDIRRGMAFLYGTEHLPAQALAQWDRWIPVHQHDVGLAQALNARCWDRVELGVDLDKALDDCDDAVDIEGKNASFLDSRGWVYLRKSQWKKALADFDRALAIDPKNTWSLYGRSQAKRALGGADRGDADLAAARSLRPGIDADARRDGLPLAPPPVQATAPAASATSAASASASAASASAS